MTDGRLILFLDVDGVLNRHDRHGNEYCGIHPERLAMVDAVVRLTGCRVVLASAWRYLILGRSMALTGFKNLLRTYGSVETADALVGYLPEDVFPNDPDDRGNLARAWMAARPWYDRAVALDDGAWPYGTDLGYALNGIPRVGPHPTVGLTVADADRLVRLLTEGLS